MKVLVLNTCDNWRSYSSFKLCAIYSDNATGRRKLFKDLREKHKEELKGFFEENNTKNFGINDLFEQRIKNLNLESIELNEYIG